MTTPKAAKAETADTAVLAEYSAHLPDPKVVKYAEREFVVPVLPWGKLARIIKLLADTAGVAVIGMSVPAFIAQNADRASEILGIALDLDPAEVDKMPPDLVAELFDALLTLNNKFFQERVLPHLGRLLGGAAPASAN
ncbi:MAG: hypothetical protein JSS20_08755 [Proteobacteria bacterium]|nr:hypothetical protein [Pseudomonadota bacterium]